MRFVRVGVWTTLASCKQLNDWRRINDVSLLDIQKRNETIRTNTEEHRLRDATAVMIALQQSRLRRLHARQAGAERQRHALVAVVQLNKPTRMSAARSTKTQATKSSANKPMRCATAQTREVLSCLDIHLSSRRQLNTQKNDVRSTTKNKLRRTNVAATTRVFFSHFDETSVVLK